MAETEQQAIEIKLNVPWGHIAAKSYGLSTGQPVLMVHGVLDNAGSFTRLMKYLPTNYHYVCVDLPGHGWSSHFPSWQIVDFMNYVHTIHFILEALQWQTCIYIGHSMGAQIGIIFSLLQPHRIKKIIALDGLVPLLAKNVIKNFKDTFAFTMKINNNAKSYLYTKEEVLYALKNLRILSLNSDAANALFDRAVTKINGKYKYNRDIRLKVEALSLMDIDQYILFIREVAVPLYAIVASEGASLFMDISKVIKSINPKTLSEIIPVNGNHDVHNNNPEIVAPSICKILNGDNSSKL